MEQMVSMRKDGHEIFYILDCQFYELTKNSAQFCY